MSKIRIDISNIKTELGSGSVTISLSDSKDTEIVPIIIGIE